MITLHLSMIGFMRYVMKSKKEVLTILKLPMPTEFVPIGLIEIYLKRMREIGFYYIGFGVECGNDKILKNIKKGERMAQIREAIETACDLGYDVVLNFLIGSPGESWDDIEDSVALALEYPVMDVRFNNITPTPRSELFDWLEENNYFVQNPNTI